MGEGVNAGDDQQGERERQRQLVEACFADPEQAKTLLKQSPDLIHCRDTVGETAFHYVVVEERLDLAELLLSAGADINTQTCFGDTPLMHAAMLGNLELVRWLVSRGATLEPKNVNGESVLVTAASNERAEIFEFLIQLPRQHPIDFYFDDLTAQRIFDGADLVMREQLLQLGLTARFG